jgi:hypothetical protein
MRYMGDLPQGGIDKSTLLRECVPPPPNPRAIRHTLPF